MSDCRNRSLGAIIGFYCDRGCRALMLVLYTLVPVEIACRCKEPVTVSAFIRLLIRVGQHVVNEEVWACKEFAAFRACTRLWVNMKFFVRF